MSDGLSSEKLMVGQINGIFGVQGWVKVFSHTESRKNIFDYSPWWIKFKGEWQQVKVVDSRVQSGGKTLVAQLENVNDRDVAREYMGCKIAIQRSELVRPNDGWLWIDLIGCQVTTLQSIKLGEVSDMIETGVHDVLRIKGTGEDILIPFVITHFVQSVDIESKQIIVDWVLEEDSEI